MTNYIEFVNQQIRTVLASRGRVVAFGQNVSTGSCLSGLARGIDKIPSCTVINTTNAENTLVGMGFGLMLKGISSIFFMKQQDFLLLGIDQLTNTWNALRNRPLSASFTIVAVIVDSGFEGPQSCLNNLPDFSSISRIPGYTITNQADAVAVLDRHLVAPGVRILGISQRLFRTPILNHGTPEVIDSDAGVIAHARGDAATIVAFNLAFPEAFALYQDLATSGLRASLFSVATAIPDSLKALVDDVARTGRLVVLDDVKSINAPALRLVALVRAVLPSAQVTVAVRGWTPEAATPNADRLNVDMTAVRAALGLLT